MPTPAPASLSGLLGLAGSIAAKRAAPYLRCVSFACGRREEEIKQQHNRAELKYQYRRWKRAATKERASYHVTLRNEIATDVLIAQVLSQVVPLSWSAGVQEEGQPADSDRCVHFADSRLHATFTDEAPS